MTEKEYINVSTHTKVKDAYKLLSGLEPTCSDQIIKESEYHTVMQLLFKWQKLLSEKIKIKE